MHQLDTVDDIWLQIDVFDFNGYFRMAAPERPPAGTGLPSAEELLLLLEQQDVMLESLVEEVSHCKKVIADLTGQIEGQQHSAQVPATSNEQMKDMRRDIKGALRTIDDLRDQKKALEAEIERLKNEGETSSPLKAVDDLQAKNREVEFEKDRIGRELAAERSEKERLRSRVEELEKAAVSMEDARHTWEAESSASLRDLRASSEESRFRAEEAQHSLQQLQQQSAAQLEVVQQRAAHAELHAKKIAEELASLRKERASLLARTDFLTRETNELRTKILNSGVAGGSATTGPDDQTRRLLREQAELIRTLRAECGLLAERMEEQAARHKSSVRELKRDNRELEQRLEKLLKI